MENERKAAVPATVGAVVLCEMGQCDRPAEFMMESGIIGNPDRAVCARCSFAHRHLGFRHEPIAQNMVLTDTEANAPHEPRRDSGVALDGVVGLPEDDR